MRIPKKYLLLLSVLALSLLPAFSVSLSDIHKLSKQKPTKAARTLKNNGWSKIKKSEDTTLLTKANDTMKIVKNSNKNCDLFFSLSNRSINDIISDEDKTLLFKHASTKKGEHYYYKIDDFLLHIFIDKNTGKIILSHTAKDPTFWQNENNFEKHCVQYVIGEYIEDEGGILFYVSPDSTEGFILAMRDARPGKNSEWGFDGTDIDGAKPFTTKDWHKANHDLDGKGNTNALLSSIDTSLSNKDFSFILAANYNAANKTDWYLPSIGQLNIIKRNLDTINKSLTQNGGIRLAKAWYWSSTEFDKIFAWAINFGTSTIGQSAKKGHDKTRAVRTIKIEK